MLAYVFWHAPRAGVQAREYECLHREFHEQLRRSMVPGLLELKAFRSARVPWLGGPAYEDWHLLEDSAGLDRLNQAAVTQSRKLPHDRIAALAGDGTAGLYGVRLGQPITPAVAYWISKPEGMSYAAFEGTLAPQIADGCCLWGRRMTLGPTPEFCLHSSCQRVLPHPALAIELNELPREGSAT